MPRKKNSSIETLPPEDSPRPTRRQVVAAKHTVVYEAPEVVEIPIEDDEEEERQGDAVEVEQAQRQPSFRMKIRDRFKQRGIGVDETLMLRIDRLPFFEQNGLAGVRSDKEFCGVLPCKENFFDGDEYLIEIQRRYGPGDYQLTVRHKNFIVSSWREHIGGFSLPAVAVQSSEPGQPPQMIYPAPMGQSQAMPAKTIKDEMREVGEIIKLIDNIRGPREDAPPAVRTEDEVLATAILKQPDVLENVMGSMLKRYRGNGGGDDDPSPWSVAMELVKSGQAAQIVKTLIDSFFNGVNGMIPGRQQNGATPLAQAPHANMGDVQNPSPDNRQAGTLRQDQNIQALAQGPPSAVETGAPANTGQQLTPAEQALTTLISDCGKKIPPRVSFTNLMTFADAVNDQAPAYSIDGWIDYLASMPIDDAIEFVKTLPNGAEVAALPHAREWTEQIQTLIRESQEGGDEA
jgi:hypothetical protein